MRPYTKFGGDEGGRTPYLLNAIQALYQLSYTPTGALRGLLYNTFGEMSTVLG